MNLLQFVNETTPSLKNSRTALYSYVLRLLVLEIICPWSISQTLTPS